MGMREIAPFGLRLTPKLKARLEAEATAGGRSLQKEIVMRLEASLVVNAGPNEARQPIAVYDIGGNEVEAAMLRVFRDWPVEKQLGFLTLFKK